MNSEIYQLDNTQKLRVMSETGSSIEVELYYSEDRGKAWEYVTTFYFENKKALELFYKVCYQVMNNEEFSS